MARVTAVQVQGLIDTDSSLSAVEWAALVDPFIATATALADYVESKDSDSQLTAALLVQIEMYLAAHFYEHLDPQPAREKTGDASADFQGEFAMGLDSSKWGQTAKRLDVTGTLASLDRTRHRVSVQWLGLAPSEQTDYVDRD